MYKIRKPQQIVIDKIKEAILNGNKKILVSAPTGFGKTILSYIIAKSALNKGNKVLFTSHRIVLAEQTRDKFKDLNPSYLQGKSDGYKEDYTLLVATIHTLLKTKIKEPKIIIIDEVHYAYNSSLIKSIFEKFPNSIFIGLSATPVNDKNFLLEGFNSIVDTYQSKDMIDLGWLVPFKVFSPLKVPLNGLKIYKDDYQKKELGEIIEKSDITDSVSDNYIKLGENRKFICFALNIDHCKNLQKSFSKKGITTEIISAGVTSVGREEIFENFKKNKVQGLISIEILTAGFDDPTVSCVILATPTKSWKKYIQCAGRGIRLLGNSLEESIKNGKKDCILLDCSGAVEEHGMPDERKILKFGKKISKVIDKDLKLDLSLENRENINSTISVEKQVFLKRIGSLLDLYDGRVYDKESDLQNDVNKFLEKTNYFYWRQNSGKMYKDGRWIHFASKAGLPDNTVFYKNTSFYFGLELKMKYGRLTEHQKDTLPEMHRNNVLFFICESVYDVYKAIEHVENNIVIGDTSFTVNDSIYTLSDTQIKYRTKLKLPII